MYAYSSFPSYQNSTEQYGACSTGSSFYSKIVGVTFNGRQQYISQLKAGEELTLKREPGNQYDRNAIALYDSRGNQLGYISRALASDMAPMIDNGSRYRICVSDVTGGDGYCYGANISICRLN